MSTIVTRAGKGAALTWTEGDANITNLNNDKIEAVVDDTAPELGGDLDVNGHKITATTGNIELDPGTGNIVLDGLTWPVPAGGGGGGGGSISGTISSSSSATNRLSLDTTAGMSVGNSITFTGTDISSIGLGMGSYYLIDIWPLSNEIQVSMTMGGAAQSLNTGSGYTDAHFQVTSGGGGGGGGGTDQYLAYNSGTSSLSWTTPSTPSSNLSSLTDVMVTGASTGQVLTYDGSTMKWKNQNAASGGLTDIVQDTTPQLGGTLDANGNDIDMGTNAITDTKVGNWDTAYSWGNHASAGYLSSEAYTGTVTSVGGTGTVNGLSLSGTITSTGNLTLGGTLDLSSPPAIGATTPSTGKFTTLTTTGSVNLTGASVNINGGTTGNLSIKASSTLVDATHAVLLLLNGSTSTMDGVSIGSSIAMPGKFTSLQFNSTIETPASVTYAATITPDCANGTVQKVTLAGNVTFSAFANPTTGQSLTLIITQDATGGRTLTSTMLFAGASKTLSTAANAVDIMTVFYAGGGIYYASLAKGFA